MAARAARPTSFLSCGRTFIIGPPVGGIHGRVAMPCMERIAIAMQDGGAGAGARAASQPHFVLPPNLYNEPPGRGDFLVPNFHPGPIPGNLVRNDFWR